MEKKDSKHPVNYVVSARCVCKHEEAFYSTEKEIIVSFCSKCHPFFTGQQLHADVEGRIVKYYKKYGKDAGKVKA